MIFATGTSIGSPPPTLTVTVSGTVPAGTLILPVIGVVSSSAGTIGPFTSTVGAVGAVGSGVKEGSLVLSSSVAAITPPTTAPPTNQGKRPINLLPSTAGNKASSPGIPLKPDTPSNQ